MTTSQCAITTPPPGDNVMIPAAPVTSDLIERASSTIICGTDSDHSDSKITSNFSAPRDAFLPQCHDFVINNPTMISSTHNHICTDNMKILLKYTVLGADMDSSDRDPPPRCHPGTRVTLRQRLLQSALKPEARAISLVWLKGPAGVGKSAILQSVAESLFLIPQAPKPGASFFFSRSESTGNRSDPRRLFTTIAY